MSKELEERVENLMRLEEEKKDAGRSERQARKAFDEEYQTVMAMVDSGHTLPAGSANFVEVVDGTNGRVNYKYVVDQFVEAHAQYRNTINGLIKESREQPVRKLTYGPVATSS